MNDDGMICKWQLFDILMPLCHGRCDDVGAALSFCVA